MRRLLLICAALTLTGAAPPPQSRTQVVLDRILHLPVWQHDAELSRDERARLLRPVAEAIAGAARSREEIAALVALGWHESRYARYVVEGRCDEGPPGLRCDMGRDGKPRARGPWQVWKWCRAAWALPAGTPASLRYEARCVVGAMRVAQARCDEGWESAFAGLAGARCEWPPAKRRVWTMRQVLARL